MNRPAAPAGQPPQSHYSQPHIQQQMQQQQQNNVNHHGNGPNIEHAPDEGHGGR